MPDDDNLDWIKTTTNELNNLLQVIQESVEQLGRTVNVDEGSARYFAIIRNGIDRSVAVTRRMQQRIMDAAVEPLEHPVRHAPVPPPDTRRSPIPIPDGEKELILIVDDEDFVTLLAQRVLTDEGYRVITANSGFKALDIFRKIGDRIDLVILDFAMPVMDGAEVFNDLRIINPKVAVVLSSGFAEQEKLRWMLSRGLRGFVPKPYTQEKLLSQVRSVLDSIKAES